MNTFDEEELIAQLAQLDLEEDAISSRRRKLHERIAIFPSPALIDAEREVSLQRRALHGRIDAIRAELAALRTGTTAEHV